MGDDQWEVSHIFLALDLTSETLEEAISAGADMIVTHHPMIFSGMKKINNHDFVGRKVLSLIRHGIACYAMHTNYDVLGMAELSGDYLGLTEREVLSVTEERDGKAEGIGRLGMLPRAMTLKECALAVKDALHLGDVRIYGDPERMVERAAVCTGSGKSMIREAISGGAQVYITGDIDHHTGIDAVDQGLAVIDAGHYGTEYIFMEAMKKELEGELPNIKLSCARAKFPYTMV